MSSWAEVAKDLLEDEDFGLQLKKDNGWIRFYPNSNSYSPDTDDTVLFYIALIKKSLSYKSECSFILA